MSSNPKQNPALHAMILAASAMTPAFSHPPCQQQNRWSMTSCEPVPAALSAGSETLSTLQKELPLRQAELWQAMLEKAAAESCSHVGIVIKLGNRCFVMEATPPVVRLYPLSKLESFYVIKSRGRGKHCPLTPAPDLIGLLPTIFRLARIR